MLCLGSRRDDSLQTVELYYIQEKYKQSKVQECGIQEKIQKDKKEVVKSRNKEEEEKLLLRMESPNARPTASRLLILPLRTKPPFLVTSATTSGSPAL